MVGPVQDGGTPTVRTFKRTFRYGSHHIEETRWVEGSFGRVSKVTLRHVIDGWDQIDNTYLPYIFKYLDVVDSKHGKTACLYGR
jgi:hypothetical protein